MKLKMFCFFLLIVIFSFNEAGFSIEDILQIVTINGAESIDINEKFGSLEVGKKADLLIFDKNPFKDYKNFLSNKIIVKDGIVYDNY